VAKQVAESKKGLSFKKAKGLGKMELKCVGEPPEGTRFRVAFLAGPGVKHDGLGNNSGIISGEPAKRMRRRETQSSHDFGKHPTLGLNGNDDIWDFSSLVDKKKHIVFIGIEMLQQRDATEKGPNLEHAQTCSPEIDVSGYSRRIWSASHATGSAVDDAEQLQEQFRFRQLLKAAMLGSPSGLGLIGFGPPPGLEMIGLGPPPGLDLIVHSPVIVA